VPLHLISCYDVGMSDTHQGLQRLKQIPVPYYHAISGTNKCCRNVCVFSLYKIKLNDGILRGNKSIAVYRNL